MPRFRPKGGLAKSASEDLFRHTLSRIPTAYGRLSYLSSLRDSSTGIYRHHGLSSTFGRDEAGNALRQSHESTFREWLNLSLSEKYDDLAKYLAGLGSPKEETLAHWKQTRIYQSQVPPGASQAEKDYFTSDLDVLLGILSSADGGAMPGPASSPPG